MDPLILSRIQFASTIAFHFLFPPLSIGLAWVLVALEAAARLKKDPDLTAMAKFFQRLFLLTFAAGVVSGIVMSLQFGTNWSRFTDAVNSVFGSLLLSEVFFAFFLESAALGIYVFGRDRLPGWLHWVSALVLAVGATLSGFWILSANSWMHSPAGYILEHGKFVMRDFGAVLFNPSFWPRFFHTMVSCMIFGLFMTTGACAYQLLKGRDCPAVRRVLAISLVAAFLFSAMQAFPSGHGQVVSVEQNQPAKLATIEGVFKTRDHAPLLLFGIPRSNPSRVVAAIEFPGLLSFLFDFKGDHVVKGLPDLPKEDRPPFVASFLTFHLMVYLGVGMILLSGFGVFLLWRKKLFDNRLFLKILVALIPVPVAAIQLGWMTTEIGRQPWIIYHLMKTADAVSITVSSGQILFSLVLIGLLYAAVLSAFLVFLVRAFRQGPAFGQGR